MTDKDFLVAFLSDGQPHTLNEILRRSFDVRGHGLTVHSRVSDLRKDGFAIAWWQQPGEKRGNSSVYQLVGSPTSLGEAAPDAAAASAAAASPSEVLSSSPTEASLQAAGDGPHAGQATNLVGEAPVRENGAHAEAPPSPVQLTVWEAA